MSINIDYSQDGNSLFENVYITGLLDYDFSSDNLKVNSLEINNNVTVVEKDKKRASVLRSNLKRLKFDIEIKADDALNLNENKKYEVILIEAPSSSIGTIRKNPEILFRKTNINLYR